MHISFLTPEFPHEKVAHAAGIGTSIKNLAEALTKEGIKVTVFVYGQKTQEVLIENGLEIHLIKNKKFKFFGWFFHRKYIQQYCNSVIKQEHIELLEVIDWTGISAFMNFKVPIVMRFHGSDAYFCHLEKRKQKAKNFWFEKLAVKGAKDFIAPTKFAGEVSKELFKIKNKAITTIYNGIELGCFQNNNPEIFEKESILYIGTLIRKKGVLELPEIFNKVRDVLPHARLILIGGDSYDIKTNSNSTWKLMQNQFKNDDLKNVSYLGSISYSEVQNYIKRANVCVFPSFAETFGMVTIEAMALQKAIVNSDIGWSKELIINEESGFLVHPENHDLYAEKIIQLLKDDLFCLQMGKQARTRVEDNFDSNKIAKRNIEFYQKTINQNK
ncbi:glycosyltransferase involved in cell wall biosynthesis [Flavobacterium sp. 90]|uniref:glycosyltransferase family 4 protein n=1 Tax=unclassified Flavobacterium TaxID=196869 RepID=UPI000EB1F113|nr:MULTISPECIES: glycosyltransferase family 4 protein [unclassified Flavobacterium]RKR10954.1 glycosyltransferase involved in cell wall biosynthesis [Flavobacterium sp. 81]TCK54738.1 glycosyltransferase involved in cell wall biosynthesis [Flavobacterium sp. 90]